MVDFDSLILERLIDEAWKYQFLTYPNPPVGACVVKSNTILSLETHKEAGKPHAEVLAFKEAYKVLSDDSLVDNYTNSEDIHNYLCKHAKNIFEDCTLYITLEPCVHYGKTPPCAELISILKPKRVVYAHEDPNKIASGGAEFLLSKGVYIEKNSSVEKKAAELIFPFTIWQKRAFLFYKLAIRLDGSYDGGVITSISSRRLVHEMRSKVDLLAIGGQSVMIDRPILDCRLVKKRAPDIQILTSKEVDRSIPLFDVPDRDVSIKKELDLSRPSLIMVEGGGRLLEALSPKVDILGLFVAPKTGGKTSLGPNLNLEHIHSFDIDIDTLSYYKLLHSHF